MHDWGHVAQIFEVAAAHSNPLTACRGLSSCFWISNCSQARSPALWLLQSRLEALLPVWSRRWCPSLCGTGTCSPSGEQQHRQLQPQSLHSAGACSPSILLQQSAQLPAAYVLNAAPSARLTLKAVQGQSDMWTRLRVDAFWGRSHLAAVCVGMPHMSGCASECMTANPSQVVWPAGW